MTPKKRKAVRKVKARKPPAIHNHYFTTIEPYEDQGNFVFIYDAKYLNAKDCRRLANWLNLSAAYLEQESRK